MARLFNIGGIRAEANHKGELVNDIKFDLVITPTLDLVVGVAKCLSTNTLVPSVIASLSYYGP